VTFTTTSMLKDQSHSMTASREYLMLISTTTPFSDKRVLK